jgi:tetraacyldisaccharide 4'-kinase
LTDHGNLFTRDFYLPSGDLRDLRSSYKRADIIVVTKCRHDLSGKEQQKIIREIKPMAHQSVFFTSIEYGEPYHISEKKTTKLNEEQEVLLVTGIANPRPLKKMLEEKCKAYYMMQYPDHFIFNIDDLREIIKKFRSMDARNKLILTTEKDAVRLVKFNNVINELPLYVQPVCHRFLFNEETVFNEEVTDFIKNFN